jgi:glycosyltransferase involved in cell wall biosynthesis
MEAMAMGLPVVVSGVGGISEIVESGRTGYLIRPDDGRNLREALESLIDDDELRRTMGAAGRARAEARFDGQKVAQKLFSLLETVSSKGVAKNARFEENAASQAF